MNLPVETRLPFLDLRLLNFLLALPPLPWFVGKEILRQAGRDRLPMAICQRPKTALGGLPFYLALQRQGFPGEIFSHESNSGINAYVNQRLLAIAAGSSLPPMLAWGCLRPVSLHYWLQRYCGSCGCVGRSASANTVDSN
ncbi:MAG: hypothetical protein HC838_08905 [Spirulinaceae cyanobacterium RM2_2_10]|nr:hypothetical protein [Spirulinaceae cyanobacterium RM2_2_10]